MSSVRRYYSDVLYTHTRKDILLSLQNLYESLPCIPTLPFEAIAENVLVPSDAEFDTRPSHLVKEQLALLPLIAFADDIDRSEGLEDEVLEWYDDAVGHVLMVAGDAHGVDCLMGDVGVEDHERCDVSDVCPWRFLERHLGDPLRQEDFGDTFYNERPSWARTLVLAKLDIGKRYGILMPTYVEQAANSYDQAWLRFMFGDDDASHEI